MYNEKGCLLSYQNEREREVIGMKKMITAAVCAVMVALSSASVFADSITYEVPAKLMNAQQKDKPSMANKALKEGVQVEVDEDGSEVTLYLQPLEFGGIKENLSKLFLIEDNKKIEAEKSNTGTEPYNVKVKIKTSKVKPDSLDMAVWVKAMDNILGGKEGAGEQKVTLVLDWKSAKQLKDEEEVSEKEVNEKEVKQVEEKEIKKEEPAQTPIVLKDSEIGVLVDGKRVNFDTPPVSREGRTLVPLRAIFEALDAEVKWDSKSQTITAVKESKVVTLVLNKTDAKIADESGTKTIKLEVPAGLEKGRTYVPLRFIGEAFGNKVSFQKHGKGSLIVID